MASRGAGPFQLRWSTGVLSGDMSVASITSQPINLKHEKDCGVQLVWTGTPTGTFTFEVNMQFNQRGTDPFAIENEQGTWTQLTMATAPTSPSGTASDTFVDLSELPAEWVRVKYTRTSGTGTLTGFAKQKG